MLTDMLNAVAGSRLLAGVMLVTFDPHATALGEKIGARIVTDGARDGHTGSVNAGRRVLSGEGRGGMITVPGDIPATRAGEIDAVLSVHLAGPSFTITPAHDDLGSNAVVCSPPESVPLRFGDNSYFPHLNAARLHGIEPTELRWISTIRWIWRSSCACRNQPALAPARCLRNLACPGYWPRAA
jgi:2-phospho-L-lactate guanylyltransferase